MAFSGGSPPAWTAVSGSGASTTSATVPSLTNGTRYYFRVRATNAGGNGPHAQTTIQLAASPSAAVTISDANLRTVLEGALGKSAGATITQLDMAGLTSLSHNYPSASSRISVLTGIEHAVNVKSLWLSGNSISDVSLLGALTPLSVLRLNQNSISDVSSLGALTSLTELHLSWNRSISDISALGALTSLEVLALSHTSVSDLSPLRTLTALTGLYLLYSSVSDISALGALTALTNLGLRGNLSISDVSALGTLTSLRTLSLDQTSVSDLSPLRTLTSLTDLSVYQASISDVSTIGTLTSLTDLELNGNSISDVSALGTLTSLRVLMLHSNSISDISSLADLERLAFVDLHDNRVSSIRDLAEGQAFSVPAAFDGFYSRRLRESVDFSGGPVLYLTGNPLCMRTIDTHIPVLRERGVRVHFDPTPVVCGPPPAPAGLTASALADGRVALRWTPAGGASYELRRGRIDADLGDWAAIAGAGAATDNHLIEGLASGFTYVFELRAVNEEGAGPSARVEVTLPDAPQAAAVVADHRLAARVAAALGKDVGAAFTRGELATIATLDLSRASAPPILGGRPPTMHDAGTGAPISDLAGIELLVNLRRLNLDGNAVRDLAPLRALKHLEWLSVRGQALTSDSVYVHIPALQARGVEVLFDAPVIVAFADAGLRGSVEGTLGKRGGATLTQGDLLGLRVLNAAAAGVADVSGIEMATNLERLDLSGNRLRDVGTLARLPALRWLDLSDNGLSDVSALSGLAGLQELLLGGNALADVSPLSHLAGLRALVLSDNELEDVSALSRLTALEELWLADNRLVDLTPLAGLTSLRYLHLGGNHVVDVSPLRALGDLTRLWLNGNRLTDLAPVLGLRSLERLDAAGNRVTDVRLTGAPLKRLRLDDNLIANVEGLANSRLGEGAVVGLRGNPLSAASVETHVPALHKRGVAVLAGRPVPLFPSAADASGRVGFVRVLNRSDKAGEVLISAVDDAGERFGPVRLALGAGAAAHFNSDDLEAGNPEKGLNEGVGAPSVAGDWRLELLSALDIAVLAYMRTPDGFLTAVHDTLPRVNAGRTLRASFFNPGRNRAQRSMLRLVNPGAVDEPVSVWGVDDSGTGRLATGISAPAGGALTVDAAELERPSTGGIWRGLGRGKGKWRLDVHARWPVEAASLLESPTGHLANLSAAPRADADGTWRVPLFPTAGDDGGQAGREGFLRIANRNGWAGEVRVWATDDSGHRVGPVSVTLGASATIHLNSDDLERGNAVKGLPVGVGATTRGDWRLALTSDLDIEVASYIRHADGFVTGMHELAPWSDTNSAARVVFLNPASNRGQRSLLRLINNGAEAASVVIAGVDDAAQPGGEARLTISAGEAVTIWADELENGGELLEGALGDGKGKWRLTVTADRPVDVMSLLESPTGHLSNLSSADG